MSGQVYNLIKDVVTGSDNQLLDMTQTIRTGIVRNLTKGNQEVPEDPKEVGILLEVMKDIDRTALAKTKIASDVAKGNQDREAMLLMAKIAAKTSVKDNPMRSLTPVDNVEQTFDPRQLPAPNFVKGEMEVGVEVENFDSFIERVEPEMFKDS